jgi:chromosome segregation ATPase
MKKLIHITPIVMVVIVLSGCKPKTSSDEEIYKLQERQAQVLESQDKSLDDMHQLMDSLENEKLTFIGQRDLKDQQIKTLEKNQQLLVDRLNQKETSDVSTEKARLKESVATYEDSISALKAELASLDHDLDSIEIRIELYRVQETNADEILPSGISELDQKITRLEKQKQQKIKNADLLKRRIEIAQKKIEAFDLERKMYQDKMDELLRINATDDQLAPFRNKIAEMDSIISKQQSQVRDLDRELGQTMQWITETDSVMNDVQSKIELQYDRNEIIEGFIPAEKQRLGKELDRLEKERKGLLSEQEMIKADLDSTEVMISSLNRRLELIRNRDMSDILDLQAALERSDAGLDKEEIQLLNESAGTNRQGMEVTSDSTSDEFRSLIALSNRLDSLKASVQEEKTGMVRARLELSEKKAQAADQRARFGRTMGIFVLILVLGGIVLLTFFYYLGRRARTSS